MEMDEQWWKDTEDRIYKTWFSGRSHWKDLWGPGLKTDQVQVDYSALKGCRATEAQEILGNKWWNTENSLANDIGSTDTQQTGS